MRTKSLLLAAAALAAGVLSSHAQGGTVYSANIVGYVNQKLPFNHYTLITPTLQATSTNSAEDVFPALQSGDTILTWSGSAYGSYTFISTGVWQDSNGHAVPAPLLGNGNALFYLNGSGLDETNTTVGTVLLTNLVTLPYNTYALVGSTPPVSDSLEGTNLNLPLQSGDEVLLWNSTNSTYQPYTYVSPGVWQLPSGGAGAAPTLPVGAGFFYLNGSGAAETWTNTITVQ
jgi:hypothetical protein